VYILLAFISL